MRGAEVVGLDREQRVRHLCAGVVAEGHQHRPRLGHVGPLDALAGHRAQVVGDALEVGGIEQPAGVSRRGAAGLDREREGGHRRAESPPRSNRGGGRGCSPGVRGRMGRRHGEVRGGRRPARRAGRVPREEHVAWVNRSASCARMSRLAERVHRIGANEHPSSKSVLYSVVERGEYDARGRGNASEERADRV